MNQLAIQENQLTAQDVKANVQLIQSVMKEVMIKDTHYGVIPYTEKNTLYKAGSEILLTIASSTGDSVFNTPSKYFLSSIFFSFY